MCSQAAQAAIGDSDGLERNFIAWRNGFRLE